MRSSVAARRTLAACLALAVPALAAALPASPNHLLGQTSPYLLEHLHNPVDWYPWGDEAFTRARREDKPIFLSIGYSACHWCHVMAREAFSDPEIARLFDEGFVAIKVDGAERARGDRASATDRAAAGRPRDGGPGRGRDARRRPGDAARWLRRRERRLRRAAPVPAARSALVAARS